MIIRPFRYLTDPICRYLHIPWSILRRANIQANNYSIEYEDLWVKTDEI